MKSDNKYSDLRSKTFLNFSPSNEALDEILGGHSKEDVELFMSCVASEDMVQFRMITFMDFTAFTKDKQLKEAIEKEFGAEHELIFNE